ncbi:MAG TPA: hypothetical protein VLY23_12300 [Candidatus Acidoferrum sp.]|nr:hypothetical protein [Candidatus Acidoferrum sp.]
MSPENDAAPASGAAGPGAFALILQVGLIAGTLDITEALVFSASRGVTPFIVFQYIASGLIGMKAAVELGMTAVALGAVLHYLIAMIWTAIFYAASRKMAILLRRPVICGLLYGGFVYVVMNWVVLPLSRVPHQTAPVTLASRVNGVLAVLLCIGLTIALLIAGAKRDGRAGLRQG